MLEGKKIALGVTGGIAAYKAVTLVSRLVQAGAQVRVIMTEAATHLVSPLLFKEISGNPVATDLWAGNAEFNVEHVAIGRWCDLMVVAPATADIIGKMANGIADDLLSTTLMACDRPKIICPAMNTNMLENPAVVRNLATLHQDGITIMPSAAGHLACGVNGSGRLPEPEDIKAFLDAFLASREGDLRGLRILVTAGGTREAIDPVRFIGNRSSGKMGYAIAREAMLRGAQVTLVSGPVDLPLVPFVETRPVTTAADMFRAVRDLLPATDVLIKAAAVADYRPAQVASDKMKKSDQDLSIPLERTDDILGWVAEHRHPGLFVCGFSMETRDMVANSRAKLERKKLDMIVANNVKVAVGIVGTKTNVVTLITREGERELPLMGKDQVAAHLLDEIQRRR